MERTPTDTSGGAGERRSRRSPAPPAPGAADATTTVAADVAAPAARLSRAAHASEHYNTALRKLVVELGEQISSANDTTAIMRTTAEALISATGIDGCDIFLLDGAALHCVVSLTKDGPDEEFTGGVIDLATWPRTAHAIAERRPYIVNDVDADDVNEATKSTLGAYGYRSEFLNPLVVEDEVIGAIDLCDREPRDFDECYDFVRDVSHLISSTLASQLLLEQLKGANRGLRVLATAGMEISATLDLEQVLNTIARSMCSATVAKCCDIFAVDGDVVRGLASADCEIADPDFRSFVIPVADGHLAARVIETRERLQVFDVQEFDDVPARELEEWRKWGLVSAVAVPLVTEGRCVGAAFVYDDHPRSFGPSDLLEGLAVIAAQAIANAETFRSLELRNRENELLAEIARHTTESLNLHQIGRSTLAKLQEVVAFDGAAILLGTIGTRIEVAYSWSRSDDSHLSFVGAEAEDVWRALEAQRTLTLDLPEDLPPGMPTESLGGMRSCLLLGLFFNEKLHGCLALVSEAVGAFAAADRDLLRRVGDHLTLALNNARLYEDIQRMHVGNLKALSSALSAKDYYTLGHAARVSAYMLLLGHELGWPPDMRGEIEEAAYLHDIGKIGISDRVLLKPSGLNPHEWELMRSHPIFSADIIRPLFNEEMVLGVRHHHERWDGRGYPDGLTGKDIPVMARAMGVVDAYDAMSFRRPYRNARSYQECMAEMHRCRGKQFDPAMVDTFARVLRRMEERRDRAVRVAEKAARQLDVAKHMLLRGPADEARPEYREIADMLRKVRAANPPTRYLETMAKIDGRFVMIVDGDDDPATHVPLGDEIYADQELPEAFAGMRPDCNALIVDQFGAWVTGRVPVAGPDGNICAVVAADLPPTDSLDLEGLHSDVTETFGALIKKTVTQGARAELEAITDGMTGLYNLRYLHERMAEEIDRARESGTPLALVLCDIDDFRHFNEKRGYDEGDRAVRAISLIVEECLRGVDLAARYGGDEFAALLIGTEASGAFEVADRIRNAVGEAHFTTERDRLTISVGFACFPADGDTREQLVDKAEYARRRAKRRGRDVVVPFSEPGSGGRPRHF